jgi:predicted alpha/beta-hydrolase family hydrolase
VPSPVSIAVQAGDGTTTAKLYQAEGDRAGLTLVLAHGAGAPQTHPFMVRFATGLAARGIDVATFNFLYTERKRKLPDRMPVLEACYRSVVAAVSAHRPWAGNRLVIGGKSMGGRAASHLAASPGELEGRLDGLVLLGYPLHPPGKPDTLRVTHLAGIRVPVLVVQGERDPFGSPLELAPYFGTIPGSVTVHAVPQGDHSLAPPKRTGPPIDEVYDGVLDVIAAWLRRNGFAGA